IWDAAATKIHKELATAQFATTVAYSCDGKQLAVASEDSLVIYETDSYEVARRFDKLTDTVACLAFAPDGRTLAAGMVGGTIGLYQTVNQPFQAQPRILEGHRGMVNGLSWSINGRCLASAGFDSTVGLWEFVNGLPIASWRGHVGEATAASF